MPPILRCDIKKYIYIIYKQFGWGCLGYSWRAGGIHRGKVQKKWFTRKERKKTREITSSVCWSIQNEFVDSQYLRAGSSRLMLDSAILSVGASVSVYHLDRKIDIVKLKEPEWHKSLKHSPHCRASSSVCVAHLDRKASSLRKTHGTNMLPFSTLQSEFVSLCGSFGQEGF